MKKLILQNDDATNELGAQIAKEINKSTSNCIEIHLEGDLGAGKTFISRSNAALTRNICWPPSIRLHRGPISGRRRQAFACPPQGTP